MEAKKVILEKFRELIYMLDFDVIGELFEVAGGKVKKLGRFLGVVGYCSRVNDFVGEEEYWRRACFDCEHYLAIFDSEEMRDRQTREMQKIKEMEKLLQEIEKDIGEL